MADLMVRVTSPDYETWLQAFGSAEEGLRTAGINQWTIYRDTWNPNIVMVHFVADDLKQALAFFQSPTFQQANAASGATERTFYVAEPQGTRAARAKTTTTKTPRKTAAKPAASKTPAAAKTTKTPRRSSTKK